MIVDSELIEFLSGQVLMIIGTCNRSGMPGIARGVGVRIEDGETDVIRIFFSKSHWPHVTQHVGTGAPVAATFARPADYMTYQMKGSGAIVSCDEADRAALKAYRKMVDDNLRGALPAEHLAIWLDIYDPLTLRLEVAEVYVQTPGPRAGVRL